MAPTRREGAAMVRRYKQALWVASVLVFASIATMALSTAVAAGEYTASLGSFEPQSPVYATVGEEPTRAPIGWVEFCIEYRAECATGPTEPRDVVLTAKAWTDMLKVNAQVNESIKPMTDLEHWGVVERWNYPDDGYGDCEDYVLLKRRMLMQAGRAKPCSSPSYATRRATVTPCSRSKPIAVNSFSTIRSLRSCPGQRPAT